MLINKFFQSFLQASQVPLAGLLLSLGVAASSSTPILASSVEGSVTSSTSVATATVPADKTSKVAAIKEINNGIYLFGAQNLGRHATPTEIAEALELEPAQIREYLNIARQPISLDVRVGDNQDTELSDLLEDDGLSPEHYTTQESLRQDLDNLLAELTPQQREVITLRFGLEDGNELSLAKVGQRLNLSRERVRQLEHQALAHLRRRHATVREYVAS